MRGTVAAVLVIAMMAFTGCTDDPEPRFEDPTETPSASDPTSSAAAEPEPWEEKSKAGAEAFVVYWISTFNDATAGGGTARLARLSSPGCGTCGSVIERLKSIYAEGGYFKGEGYRVLFATPENIDDEGRTTVALRIRRAAERLKESAGGPLQRNPASNASYSAEVSWSSGAWRMEELVVFN